MIIEIVTAAALTCTGACYRVPPGGSVWMPAGSVGGIPADLCRKNDTAADGYIKWTEDKLQLTDNLTLCTEKERK